MGESKPADVEALRRSLSDREVALAHAVRELQQAKRFAADESARAERLIDALESKARQHEEDAERLRNEVAQLQRSAGDEVRRRTVQLEDLVRGTLARAAESSAALDERSRAAELATAEWHRLADEAGELSARLAHLTRPPAPEPILTPGAVQRLTAAARKLRCPRCASPMTEYQHQLVRADKCDECFGIFFDSGELELVIAKALEDRDAQWSTWGDLFRRG